MGPRRSRGVQRLGLAVAIVTPLALGVVLVIEFRKGFGSPHARSLGVMEALLLASVEFARDNGRYPATLGELPQVMDGVPLPRRDAWGEHLRYALRRDGLLILETFGRDAAPGGEGEDADLHRCAATRRDDGTIQLEAPEGGPLRFLEPWELTIVELQRGAREVDRRLLEGPPDAALERALDVKLVDGWGGEVSAQVVEDGALFRLVSLGSDGAPGATGDGPHAADRVVERALTPGGNGAWQTHLVHGQGERRALAEVSRAMRGDGS